MSNIRGKSGIEEIYRISGNITVNKIDKDKGVKDQRVQEQAKSGYKKDEFIKSIDVKIAEWNTAINDQTSSIEKLKDTSQNNKSNKKDIELKNNNKTKWYRGEDDFVDTLLVSSLLYLVFGILWYTLEIMFYGEIRENIVDTIISIPIYISIFYNVKYYKKNLKN